MDISERIGLDVGAVGAAVDRAPVAAAAGAKLARVSFSLHGFTEVDADYAEHARAATAALTQAGMTVVAVVDSDLTVAPSGMGAFEPGALDAMAEAWTEELRTNTARLARAIGEHVAYWELLPYPNYGSEGAGSQPRIAPERWASLLGDLAAAVRDVDREAQVISGALISDEHDDGVEYLRAAYRAGERDGRWPPEGPPFDTVGLQLWVLPDGGPSEEAVSAMLSDRVRRLWRVIEQIEGRAAARERGVLVTGVGWDAARTGEAVQARNTWVALNTLTAEDVVPAVIIAALNDTRFAIGLHEGQTATPEHRRPAWQAFLDFTLYARQISPTGEGEALLPPAPEPAPARWREAVAAQATAGRDETTSEAAATTEAPVAPEPAETAPAPEAQETQPLVTPPSPAEEADVAQPDATTGTPSPDDGPQATTEAAEAAEEVEAAAPPTDVPTAEPVEPTAEPASTVDEDPAADDAARVTFRIPDPAEVLRAQGLEGERLAAVLRALRAKYGDHEWLPPGEYTVDVTSAPAPAPADHTNQQVISAIYRAGGGTWSLFERSGLVLSELAASRNEPYDGPPLETLSGLTPEERQAVIDELAQLQREQAERSQ